MGRFMNRTGGQELEMNQAAPRCRAGLLRFAAVTLTMVWALPALANPQGMTVSGGSASVTVNGSQLNVTVSQNGYLNWQSFNIARGETTTFHQPSAASIVWNRINDPNPSQIWGHLSANGVVVLMNQSGFFFGPGSVVNAAGFVATTATTLPTFDLGGCWQFSGPPPSASIVNYGEIRVSPGGSAFLIAEKIENHGTLMAPDGTLGLYAGKEVLMSERPDGRGLSVQVRLPTGSVDNRGRLIADAGSIMMNAQTVNQDGLVQANSVRERNGVIELLASDSINLGANSSISAQGDSAAVSDGGRVTVKSDGAFTDAAGSRITVAGGLGGNGGQVELSASSLPQIHSTVDGHAAAGSSGGSLLIDPDFIVLGSTGSGSANGGQVGANDPPGTLNLNVGSATGAGSAFTGLGHITLQAKNDITLSSGTLWDLDISTGVSSPGSLLTLEAGRDINISDAAAIRAGAGWSVFMAAGANFATPNRVNPGVGSINFAGNGSLQAAEGSLTLLAGNGITLGSGSIRTVQGGNINLTAVSGTVNTGSGLASQMHGFDFSAVSAVGAGGYQTVDADLTGVSTAAGGNVSITAGQNIVGYLPGGTEATDAGSGAFGTAPGDVTLSARGSITGHYVVRNGTGTVTAGASAGTAAAPLALSLTAGGWQVNATDIALQEVRNPNGVFNNVALLGAGDAPSMHYFDYAPDAYVRLSAANSVQLLNAAFPRLSQDSVPLLYPPSLDISAKAGGVAVGDNMFLFPSPVGQLAITTTAGGSLTGSKSSSLVSLLMSDSARSRYLGLGNFDIQDHAPIPLHLNDPEPVQISIAGDMSDIVLSTPKETRISIGGNMVNSRFNIQNLHPTDVSSLNVQGDIKNRNEFTTVSKQDSSDSKQDLSDLTAPDFSPFLRAYQLDPSLASLPALFSYDPVAQTLTFQGAMSQAQYNALTKLTVQAIDPTTGALLYDVYHLPILTTVAVLPTDVANALQSRSADIPRSPDSGYQIAGPGTLNVTARNLDLGATLGIRSVGPAYNAALARLGSSGAAINVNLTGNLDMFSTTICSLAGGDIHVDADGYINVGSDIFTGSEAARGIFTVAKSDVFVTAGGNINVNGSRIAAYDGGNITVVSQTGDVDAGHGGQGSAQVQEVIVDPVTGRVLTYTPTIPGSGILATSFPAPLDPNFPASWNAPGNITVSTPQGSILASAGGIVQIALNGVASQTACITLTAGTRDAAGHVIYRGNIDATGSGVIGNNVRLDATGNVTGLLVAQHDININAQQNVNVTAIGSGNVSVSAGGSISGTIVGVGGVSASGASVDAAMLSQSGVTANNASVGSSAVFTSANAAGATAQSGASSADQQVKKTVVASASDDEAEKKKRDLAKSPVLTRRIGRVTVILPKT
jgi:filamentous hemagglutinin family protein